MILFVVDWVYGYVLEIGEEFWRVFYGEFGFLVVLWFVYLDGVVYFSMSFMWLILIVFDLNGNDEVLFGMMVMLMIKWR